MRPVPYSKSRVDRLGDELRRAVTPQAFDAYFDYRDEFTDPLEEVSNRVAARLQSEVTGRLKTLDTVIAKLRRSSIRLSQMQDIAGCRTVVEAIGHQNRAVELIALEFPGAVVDDLRAQSHAGYRAVHVIVRSSTGYLVEVQVRTELQNLWAQLSEKLADIVGSGLKYDGGPPPIRQQLEAMSSELADLDGLKDRLIRLREGDMDRLKDLEILQQSMSAEEWQAAPEASEETMIRERQQEIDHIEEEERKLEDQYRARAEEVLKFARRMVGHSG